MTHVIAFGLFVIWFALLVMTGIHGPVLVHKVLFGIPWLIIAWCGGWWVSGKLLGR